MPSIEITSFGEALIDFVSTKSTGSLVTAPGFLKAAGGAPANVAVGLSQLGIRTAFAGVVGDDSFGRFLRAELHKYGVDTRGVVATPKWKTRLAFVALSKSGERDFEFWERDPADQHTTKADADVPRLARSKILNLGSFLLLNEPSRSTALYLAQVARRHGCLVCFDPNLRPSLWRTRNECKRVNISLIRRANIVRMNATEGRFLAGSSTIKGSIQKLLRMGPSLVVITETTGCTFGTASGIKHVPGIRVRAVDTTGCGDGFLAGLLAGIVRSRTPLINLSNAECIELCRFAHAVGALVATRHGAIPAMPKRSEVLKFMRSHG